MHLYALPRWVAEFALPYLIHLIQSVRSYDFLAMKVLKMHAFIRPDALGNYTDQEIALTSRLTGLLQTFEERFGIVAVETRRRTVLFEDVVK